MGTGSSSPSDGAQAALAKVEKRQRLSTTLLVMTLNEIDGMKAVMPRVKREWVDQILVLDGGSTDGTVEWARQQGYEVLIQSEPGFRAAYQEAWPLVRGEVVIYFTPDGNTVPEAVPQLAAKMEEGYDLVIGSRYLGNAKSQDDDLITGFGNWVFRTLLNLLLRPLNSPRMTDPLIMFRAHRKGLPRRLGLDRPEPFVGLEKLFRTRVDWIPLMSMRAMKGGVRWTELPADEPARIGGVRKLKILQWGSVYFLQLLREAILPAPKRVVALPLAPAAAPKGTGSSA